MYGAAFTPRAAAAASSGRGRRQHGSGQQKVPPLDVH